MKKELLHTLYESKKSIIQKKLEDFREISEENQFYEFLFCILTPQSNAKKCWEAIEKIKEIKILKINEITEILKTRTRFHNKKAERIIEAKKTWKKINQKLNNENTKELRDWIADNVKGYGLKEASHFLRNIGKSRNKIAILDRHILKHLKELEIIDNIEVKNRKDYYSKEQSFINFSKNIEIPIDELDLLFWSQETGEVFK